MTNDVRGDATAANVYFAYDGDKSTSLVDVEFGISAPITYWAAINVAYQGLYLSDAVGAFEQSSAQSFFDPNSQTPRLHDIQWHGVNFGLTMLWQNHPRRRTTLWCVLPFQHVLMKANGVN